MNQQNERIGEAGKNICHLLLEVVHLFCTLKLSKSNPGGTRGKNMYPLSGREGLGKRGKHMRCRVAETRQAQICKTSKQLITLKLQVNR